MDTKKVMDVLQTISECVDELKVLISGCEDHDHDQIRSDSSKRSDQIRSDHLVQRELSSFNERFLDICDRYNFDIQGIDLVKYERNIRWIVENIADIRSPRGYLERCFPDSSRKKVGFHVVKTAGFQTIKPISDIDVDEDSDDVYGAPIAEIQSKEKKLNEVIFLQLQDELATLPGDFCNWESVKKNSIKRRIITGRAIKRGIL